MQSLLSDLYFLRTRRSTTDAISSVSDNSGVTKSVLIEITLRALTRMTQNNQTLSVTCYIGVHFLRMNRAQILLVGHINAKFRLRACSILRPQFWDFVKKTRIDNPCFRSKVC